MVYTDEKIALAKINVRPYILPALSEMVEVDKVSNATILRTIHFNVNEWREWAAVGGTEYSNGRADAYQKVLELVESLQRGLK
jgi:hypothetical protein